MPATHKPAAYFVTCFALSVLFHPHPISSKRESSAPSTIPALLIANLEFSGLHCCSFVKVHCLSSSKKKIAEKEGVEPSRRFSRPTPFPGEPLRPLGYFSKLSQIAFCYLNFHSRGNPSNLAERMGFEPMRPFGQTVFKTASL